MKWRFWRKDNTPAQFDLHTLAYVTVELMIKQEPPFNQWRPDGFEVPKNAETVEWFVNIYQLVVFLDSVERKYGSDVAAVMKAHVTEIMNKGSIVSVGGSIAFSMLSETEEKHFNESRSFRTIHPSKWTSM